MLRWSAATAGSSAPAWRTDPPSTSKRASASAETARMDAVMCLHSGAGSHNQQCSVTQMCDGTSHMNVLPAQHAGATSE